MKSYLKNLFNIRHIRDDHRDVPLLRKVWDHWNDYGWTPFYCAFAFFHLMRNQVTGKFIVIFQIRGEPKIGGHYIVCSYWTRRGARRGALNQCEFDMLVDAIGGRAAMCNLINGRPPAEPESEREKAIRILSREPENLLP